MAFSPFPLKAADAANWYIERSNHETFDEESASHLIRSLVSSGWHRKAAAFVRYLEPAPKLFGPCAIILFETLCEYRYAPIARKLLPWFEKRLRSKKHLCRPCDLRLAIAETTGNGIDAQSAKQAVISESDPDIRMLRLIRIAELDCEEMERIPEIRSYIQIRVLTDPIQAFAICKALVQSTKHEIDFKLVCDIVSSIVSQYPETVYQEILDQFIGEVAIEFPDRIIRRALEHIPSATVYRYLSRLVSKQSASILSETLH